MKHRVHGMIAITAWNSSEADIASVDGTAWLNNVEEAQDSHNAEA